MSTNMNMNVILRGYVAQPVKQISSFEKKGKECNMGVITLAVKPHSASDKTEFLPITVFDKVYNLLEKYTEVGSQILVSCTLHNNTYKKIVKGKEKTEYRGLQIIGQDITFLSSPRK